MARSTAPLTPAMTDLIKATAPGEFIRTNSNTVGALVRRGILTPGPDGAILSESGLQIRAKLLPPPVPAAEVDEAKAAQIGAWLERHALRLEAMTTEAATKAAAGYHAAMAKDLDEALAEDAAWMIERSSVFQAVRLVTLNIDARPTLETLVRVSQTLGRSLRPFLEAGVRMARDIPEGRRRHGQIKARRDALRHAAKLELAGI